MKKDSPEYYWELVLEKQEKGDFLMAVKDFYELMELDLNYKNYCYRERDKEGSKFLVPIVDYNWWKENIKEKLNFNRY